MSTCETCQHARTLWDGGIECQLPIPPWLAVALDNVVGGPFMGASRRVSQYDTCHFWQLDAELEDQLHAAAYNDAMSSAKEY